MMTTSSFYCNGFRCSSSSCSLLSSMFYIGLISFLVLQQNIQQQKQQQHQLSSSSSSSSWILRGYTDWNVHIFVQSFTISSSTTTTFSNHHHVFLLTKKSQQPYKQQQQQHCNNHKNRFLSSSKVNHRIIPTITTLRNNHNDNENNNDPYSFDDDNNYDDMNHGNPNSSCYLATCIPGLGSTLAQELIQLQCCQNIVIQSPAAVTFECLTNDIKAILKVLLWTRTAHKILELLCSTSTTTTTSSSSSNTKSTKKLIQNRNDLIQFITNSVDVKDLMGNGQGGLLNLAVSVLFNNPKYIPDDINHTHYTALSIKNAIVDLVRDQHPEKIRPNVQLYDPDVPIQAIILGVPTDSTELWSTSTTRGNSKQYQSQYSQYSQSQSQPTFSSAGAHVSIYRQIHTGSLHKRGYRSTMGDGDDDDYDDRGRGGTGPIHKAALKESFAAGLLLQAQWDVQCKEAKFVQQQVQTQTTQGQKEQQQQQLDHPPPPPPAILIDPMMGSGTILIEGGMIAADIAPGLMRIKCNVPGARVPPIVRWKHDHPHELITTTRKSTTKTNKRRTESDPDHDDNDDDDDENHVMKIWEELLLDATTRAQQGLKSMKDEQQSEQQQQQQIQKKRMIQICGNDQHPSAFILAQDSIRRAGLQNIITLSTKPSNCEDWVPTLHHTTSSNSLSSSSLSSSSSSSTTSNTTTTSTPPWLIVSNPPWGIRLVDNNKESRQTSRSMDQRSTSASTDSTSTRPVALNSNQLSWEALRIFLRSTCPPSSVAWILSGNRTLTKHLGLQRSQSIPYKVGEQDLRYLQYTIRDSSSTGSYNSTRRMNRNRDDNMESNTFTNPTVENRQRGNVDISTTTPPPPGLEYSGQRIRRSGLDNIDERYNTNNYNTPYTESGRTRSRNNNNNNNFNSNNNFSNNYNNNNNKYQNRDTPRPSYMNGQTKPKVGDKNTRRTTATTTTNGSGGYSSKKKSNESTENEWDI